MIRFYVKILYDWKEASRVRSSIRQQTWVLRAKKGIGPKIRDTLFKPDSPGLWTCSCGKPRKVTRAGLTNLVNHVQTCHPEEFQAFLKAKEEETPSELSSSSTKTETKAHLLVYSQKIKDMFGCLEYILICLKLFSDVENCSISKHFRCKTPSNKTLVKYIDSLYTHVEAKKELVYQSD